MDGLAASQTDEAEVFSPKRRKGKRGPALLGAAGLVVVLGAVWAFRLPLAESILKQQLSAPGAPARLTLTRLDFGGAAASDIALGAAGSPDFTAHTVNAGFAWAWARPRLAMLGADQARLTVRMNERGVSFGALDRFTKGGSGGGGPTELPDMRITLRDLAIRFETSLGAFQAVGGAQGALRRDFTLTMRIAPTTSAGAQGALTNVRGELSARTAQGRFAGKLIAAAEALRWRNGDALNEPRFEAAFDAPIALTSAQLSAQARLAGGAFAGNAFGEVRGDALMNADDLSGGGWPKSWGGQVSAQLANVRGKDLAGDSAAARADFTGEAGKISANLVATLTNAGAFGVRAGSARLEGPFSTDLAHKPLTITARTTLHAENAALEANLRSQIMDAGRSSSACARARNATSRFS